MFTLATEHNFKEIIITRSFLRENSESVIFVFGDNNLRTGTGGAAALRNEPNTFGFVTKKKPTNEEDAFYDVDEYRLLFDRELVILKQHMAANPDKRYLLSKIGSLRANRHGIFEEVILPRIKAEFEGNPQVFFLW